MARGLWTRVAGVMLVGVVTGSLLAACGGDDEASTGASTAASTSTETTTTGTTTITVVKVNVITEELQKDLGALGFYKGAVNGDYDAATAAAVKAFQQSVGLAADGVAGPQTHAAIDFERGRGNSAAVRVLQQTLTDLCVYSGPINGVYTSATEAAVTHFQEAQKLTADGQFGPQTAKALVAAHANRPASCASTPAKPAATDTTSGATAKATVTVSGRAYGPKTFEVTSCKNAGETDLDLTATAAGGFTLVINAKNGTGTIKISGGNEQDGILLNGNVTRLSVGDAGDIRGSGTFTPASAGSSNATFVMVGRCAA